MFFGPPLFRILNFDYSIYKYHTITVRIFLLHTRSISLGILDYQLLWQNVNVNFFPPFDATICIHYYKTQTKLLKYIWESEKKKFGFLDCDIFCMRFIAKCSPSSSANRRLHKQTAVYPFWFLHIICGLNFWRLFSTVKKFKFRKCVLHISNTPKRQLTVWRWDHFL